MSESDIERLDRQIDSIRSEWKSNFDTLYSLLREMIEKLVRLNSTCPERKADIQELRNGVEELEGRVAKLEKDVLIEETQRKTAVWIMRFLFALGGAFGGATLMRFLSVFAKQ